MPIEKLARVLVGGRNRVRRPNFTGFSLGDRVRMTEEGKKQCLTNHGRSSCVTTGSVEGFSRDGRLVIIGRDGAAVASSYSPDFWEREATGHDRS